jgi:hypothetical protein
VIRRLLAELNPAHVGAAVIVTLGAVGIVFVGEEEFVASRDAAVVSLPGQVVRPPAAPGLVERSVSEATVDPGDSGAVPADTSPPSSAATATAATVPVSGPVASGTTPPVRGTAVQVTDTVPPAPTVPAPVSGVCESWRPLFDAYRIPFDEALPYIQRESSCKIGAHNGNSGTRDDSFGPLQVNRYGDLAAWWDEGGYTVEVMSTPEGAVAAAAVLYHSCGWGPWTKPYHCDGTYLRTPTPRWGEW